MSLNKPENPEARRDANEIKGDTRKALDNIKAEIEKNKKQGVEFGEKEIMTAMDYVKRNSNLTSEKWAEVETSVRKEIISAIALQTDEAKAVDAMSKDTTKNGLDKATATEEKANGFLDKIAEKFSKLSDDTKKTLSSLLVTYLANQKKNNNNKESWFGSWLEKAAEKIGIETPSVKFAKFRENIKLPDNYALGEANENEIDINTADGTKIATLKFNPDNGRVSLVTSTGTFNYAKAEDLNKHIAGKLKGTVTQAPEKPEEAEQEKYAKALSAKGWILETARLTDDLKTLKDSKITDIDGLITEALGEKGKLTQILAAIKEAIPDFKNNMFKVSLADLLFQKMEDTNFQKALAVIKNEKDEYKFDKNPATLRAIIDKFNSAKDTDAIAAVATSYKKVS